MTDSASKLQNSAPAIQCLHSDVLLYIAELNADMFSDKDALKITRTTSQICQNWRHTLLSSPSLWGRLIDLDTLSWDTAYWRNEVLRRSGDALLWIMHTEWKVAVEGTRLQKLLIFFFSILNVHWSRIERLVITAKYPYCSIPPSHWQAMYLPAHRLRVFDVFTLKCVSGSSVAKPLFADRAPVLQIYHTSDSDIRFDLDATWLVNLRSINVGTQFTVSEMLLAFKQMPFLENILVEGAQRTGLKSMVLLPTAYLPNLTHMKLQSDLETCVPFLEHIIPARNCSYLLEASEIEYHLPLQIQPPPLQVLSKVLREYFSGNVPTSIFLSVRPGRVDFNDCINAEDRCYTRSGFSISMRSPNWVGISFQARQHILAACTMPIPTFNLVTKLHLESSGYPGADFKLTSFLQSLTSVRTIVTGEHMLDHIQREFGPQVVLLPLLSEVILNNLDTRCSMLLRSFLRLRRDHQIAHTISILDITGCEPKDLRPLRFLEEFEGMKVRWGISVQDGDELEKYEYECGSGHPEKLDFGTRKLPRDYWVS